MQKNQFLKVKNSLLQLEKDFIALKDREVKIKREIEELFFKSSIVSVDDMDKFEQKEMKKIKPIKNTSYDWLINCIPEPVGKSVGKLVFLRQIHLNKLYWRGKKLSKQKTKTI